MLITFEGGEGAGKSTLIHALAQKLSELKISTLEIREPGSTEIGEKLRQLLLLSDKPFEARTELYLFLAARVQLLAEVIRPSIAAGRVVLCDRFCDSTIAYQGGGRGLGLEYVEQLCLDACEQLKPDCTFLLDLKPQAGLARLSGRPQDRLEREEIDFHERTRAAFLQLAKREPQRISILDASKPPEVLATEAWQILSPKVSHVKF